NLVDLSKAKLLNFCGSCAISAYFVALNFKNQLNYTIAYFGYCYALGKNVAITRFWFTQTLSATD
ncbi:hypothetical protein, partial [Acinetobacter ursingii]|uniref:hypothetical protein n=1 Tax=Acinetobacter ursingii TaxID=108980 RepID=UPI001C089F4E